MKPKILIVIDGGMIDFVATNLPECTVVVADFDLKTGGDYPVLVSQVHEQDKTFADGEAHLLIAATNPYAQFAAGQLKDMNY